MELDDCAYPLVSDIVATDDPKVAFKDAEIALLVGARPRGPGMERKDLLEANGAIFTVQGRALDEVASRDVKVLVVGNPANTNSLIAMKSAPNLRPENFTAMMRLDHNRAVAQVAKRAGAPISGVKKVTVWGNHSTTQYPDIAHVELTNAKTPDALKVKDWRDKEFIPTVQKRGAAVIDARGLSSAASAANAAVDHVRNWVLGTDAGNWVSMGVPSDGSYGVPEGVMFGFPATCHDGHYHIVQGLTHDDDGKARMAATLKELQEERAAIAHLLK